MLNSKSDRSSSDAVAESASAPGGEMPIAREELETIVSALPAQALLRLVIIGRTLLDETRRTLPPGEQARHARAEIRTIAVALGAEELASLGALGRELLAESTRAER